MEPMEAPWANTRRKQEIYIKLFFARYFGVNKEQLGIAMGCQPLIMTRDTWYDNRAKELMNYCHLLRRRTFGKESYLDRATEHAIQRHNFEANIFNIASQAILYDIPGENEDEVAKAARIERRNALRDTQNHLVAQFRENLKRSVQAAKVEIEAERTSPPNSTIYAQYDPDRTYYKRMEDFRTWYPKLPVTFTKKADAPKDMLSYTQMSATEQEKFWRDKWNIEYAYNMLYDVRDVVAAKATVDGATEYYKSAFVFWAMECFEDYVQPMEPRIALEEVARVDAIDEAVGTEGLSKDEEQKCTKQDKGSTSSLDELTTEAEDIELEKENVQKAIDQQKAVNQQEPVGKQKAIDQQEAVSRQKATDQPEATDLHVKVEVTSSEVQTTAKKPRKKRSRYSRAIKALQTFSEKKFPDEKGLDMLEVRGPKARR